MSASRTSTSPCGVLTVIVSPLSTRTTAPSIVGGCAIALAASMTPSGGQRRPQHGIHLKSPDESRWKDSDWRIQRD